MAVAIQKLGYENIKVYNGGLKEWKKMNNPITVRESLPEYETPFIEIDQLLSKVHEAKKNSCKEPDGTPTFTLFDIRAERILNNRSDVAVIPTSCTTLTGLLDYLLDPQFRKKIPRDSPVYILSETGNRDQFVGRYLRKYGYTNVYGIRFGMRGWIKADYPIHLMRNK